MAYFGRAAYSVALGPAEKYSPSLLTVGHTRPTVYPMKPPLAIIADKHDALRHIVRAASYDEETACRRSIQHLLAESCVSAMIAEGWAERAGRSVFLSRAGFVRGCRLLA